MKDDIFYFFPNFYFFLLLIFFYFFSFPVIETQSLDKHNNVGVSQPIYDAPSPIFSKESEFPAKIVKPLSAEVDETLFGQAPIAHYDIPSSSAVTPKTDQSGDFSLYDNPTSSKIVSQEDSAKNRIEENLYDTPVTMATENMDKNYAKSTDSGYLTPVNEINQAADVQHVQFEALGPNDGDLVDVVSSGDARESDRNLLLRNSPDNFDSFA